MNVADKGEEIGVFVAQDGLVPVLKQMAGAFVPAVVVLGVPREELSHDAGDAVFAALKKQVDVVVHKDPGVYSALSFGDGVAWSLKEPALVLVVFEYVGFVDTAHHDVVQGAGDI